MNLQINEPGTALGQGSCISLLWMKQKKIPFLNIGLCVFSPLCQTQDLACYSSDPSFLQQFKQKNNLNTPLFNAIESLPLLSSFVRRYFLSQKDCCDLKLEMEENRNSGVSWSLVTQWLTTQGAPVFGVFQMGMREARGCEDFCQKHRVVSVLRFQSHASQQCQKISSLQQVEILQNNIGF